MNVLITGANRGIGLEFVRQCYRRGWRVFACCRNPHNADNLFAIAKLSNGLISVHIADLGDTGTLQALAYELRNESVDILINNGGVYGSARHSFGQIDADDWLNTFRINTIGPTKLVEYLHPHLCAGKRRLVACMSSKMASMADNGSGGSYIYRSSKAALNAVVKSLSVDLAADGITCVALHPGWVMTDMGGPDAEISAQQSVTQMLLTLTNASSNDSGRFIDIDGSDIPW